MLIGHDKVIADLKRFADSGNLSHGYIFHGQSMVGKRSVALALAKFLEKGEFEFPDEREILQDAKIFDLALAKRLDPERNGSIGIETISELKNFLWQKPAVSSRRTAIVDEAEKMTAEAQNALLRIAEEPPASTLLILTTNDSESILPTLLSRFHKIYFSPVNKETMEKWLEKDLNLKKSEAAILARKFFGKPGLARAFLNDERLKNNLKTAEQFLKLSEARRRDFIKELIEPDDFSFNEFLDAAILFTATDNFRASRREVGVDSRLWHKLLKLRSRTANFPLNPRLQLEALFL